MLQSRASKKTFGDTNGQSTAKQYRTTIRSKATLNSQTRALLVRLGHTTFSQWSDHADFFSDMRRAPEFDSVFP